MKERLIFVTNDDSYQSKGFAAAIEVARRFGRVIAIAPETVQSGKSQGITIYDMLRLRKISEQSDVTIYALNGTPVDCVKFAMDHMLKGVKIDLAISGINHGSNAAANLLYSGTMGAVIETSFYNIPSLGLSYLDESADADFTTAIEYGTQIAGKLLENPSLVPVCLNVNVPILPLEQIKGIKVCRQTRGYWEDIFYERTDPRGGKYYWLTGGFLSKEPESTDTDEWALANGYVSVVPVQVDLTAYDKLEPLKNIL